MSDTNLSNSFQKVISSDLQNVNQAIKSIFTFPKVKDQLTNVCNQLASADYFESTAASIKKEIELWKSYNASVHSPAENISFSRSVISSLKTYLQSDKNQAEREIDAARRAKRKKRHGWKKFLGGALALTFVCAPIGLAALGTAAANRPRGGDISSLEEMIRNNRRYINQLDAILRLISIVCDYQSVIS